MHECDLSLLSQIELFADLSREELTMLAGRVTLKEFRKGQVILYEEDAHDFMYGVLRGEVKVFRTTSDGKEAIVAVHGSGDSFGEISLIDQQTIPATVAALENALVALVTRDHFFDIIRHPKVLNRLLRTLTTRLRDSWSQIRLLHSKEASQRVSTLIHTLLDKRGEPSEDGMILKLRLTHQSLADMTGLTRETVTRILDKWKDSGWITTDDNRHMVIKESFFKNIPLL